MSRTKDQWIEKTGGLRFGESPSDFADRTAEIERLEKSLRSGKYDMASLERIQRRLCDLKGIDFDSYDDPDE